MTPEGSKIICWLVLGCILMWALAFVMKGNNAIERVEIKEDIAEKRADHKREIHERRRLD